jgi:hypothetical protein
MALTRQDLTPLDGYDRRIDWNAAMSRANSRLLRWLPGGRFLAAHLAIFGVTLLAAMLWALIRHPMDLDGLRPFLYWGVIAAVHAALTGIYQVAARLIGLNEPRYVTQGYPVYRSARPSVARQAAPAMLARGVGGAARVNATARRWATSTGRRGNIPTQAQTAAGWPEQPPILQMDERPDTGEVTWPDSAPRSTTLGNRTSGPPADTLVSIDPAASTEDQRGQRWLEGFVESRQKNKDQRWSWVEAAAASWLSRRDNQVTPEEKPAEDVVIDPAITESERDSAHS